MSRFTPRNERTHTHVCPTCDYEAECDFGDECALGPLSAGYSRELECASCARERWVESRGGRVRYTQHGGAR